MGCKGTSDPACVCGSSEKGWRHEEIKTHLSTPKYSPNGPLTPYPGITCLQSPLPASHRKPCGRTESPPQSSTLRNSRTRVPPACLLPAVAPGSRQPPAGFSAWGPESWLVRPGASPAWHTEAWNARPRGSRPRPAWPGQRQPPTLADLLPQVLPRRLGDLCGRHKPF